MMTQWIENVTNSGSEELARAGMVNATFVLDQKPLQPGAKMKVSDNPFTKKQVAHLLKVGAVVLTDPPEESPPVVEEKSDDELLAEMLAEEEELVEED